MASTSETGHEKNVANFKSLITYLISLGAKYAPSKPRILIPALQTISVDAGKSLSDIQAALPPFSQAVDDQEAAFAPLNKLVTRIVRAYKATVDNAEEAETAVSLQKKIAGKPVKAKKLKKDAEAGDSVLTSQLSYDNRLANFEQLVEVVSANPDYTPNEVELQPATLQALATDLRTKTEAVDAVADTLENNRIARDKVCTVPLPA